MKFRKILIPLIIMLIFAIGLFGCSIPECPEPEFNPIEECPEWGYILPDECPENWVGIDCPECICPECGECPACEDCTGKIDPSECPEVLEEDYVKIAALTAIKEDKVIESTSAMTYSRLSTKNDTDVKSPSGQYIIMYKYERDIKFTIKLDNPKGESIDAIEITCDDPDSKILVDGEFKNIQYNNGSRIINWAQEDPYEKTFYIYTSSIDDVNTIRVVDIKVNGEWQNKELDKDTLKIYKMNFDDLQWNYIVNTTEYYKWNLSYNDKISNVVVKINDNVVKCEEGNIYTVNKNGTVSISYTYTYDGVDFEWTDYKEIKLLEIGFSKQGQKSYVQGIRYSAIQIDLSGTDVVRDVIYYVDDYGNKITLTFNDWSNQYFVFFEVYEDIPAFKNDSIVIEVFGVQYILYKERYVEMKK